MYETQVGTFKVGSDEQNKAVRARLEELVNVHGWKIIQRDFLFYEQGEGGGFVYSVWLERMKDEPTVKRGRPAKVTVEPGDNEVGEAAVNILQAAMNS